MWPFKKKQYKPRPHVIEKKDTNWLVYYNGNKLEITPTNYGIYVRNGIN